MSSDQFDFLSLVFELIVEAFLLKDILGVQGKVLLCPAADLERILIFRQRLLHEILVFEFDPFGLPLFDLIIEAVIFFPFGNVDLTKLWTRSRRLGRPSHLHKILLTLKIGDVLKQIFCERFSLINLVRLSLLVFYHLKFDRRLSQNIIEHHFRQIISIVMHQSTTHFRKHTDLPVVLAQFVGICASRHIDISLGLLYLLKHWLEFVGELRHLSLQR